MANNLGDTKTRRVELSVPVWAHYRRNGDADRHQGETNPFCSACREEQAEHEVKQAFAAFFGTPNADNLNQVIRTAWILTATVNA